MTTETLSRLDQLFDEVKDLVPLSEDVELLTPSIVHGVIPQSSLGMKPQQALRESYAVKKACPDDFVISMSSHAHGVEYCSLYGGISPDYTLLRPKCDPLLIPFLKYALKSKPIIHQLSAFKTGVRMGLRLQWNKVRYCKINIPPPGHGKIIAEFLDRKTARIDTLIAKKTRFVELLNEKRRAVITKAVTKGLDNFVEMKESNVKWLGTVPKNWTVKRLKYICEVRTGKRDTADAVDDGAYPFFVRSQTVEAINSYSADCEAILTAGDGAGVGKVYHYINGKFDFHQRVYMLNNFMHVRGRYLFFYLSALFAAVALDGGAKSTVDSLRMPVFMNFQVTFPPDDEQQEIIRFIEECNLRIDTLITKTERSIELLKEHRAALITAAVTGKIDAREAA